MDNKNTFRADYSTSRAKVVVIEGARQSGKTTFAENLMEKFPGSVYVHNSETTLNTLLEDIAYISWLKADFNSTHLTQSVEDNLAVKLIIVDRWFLSGWVYHSLMLDTSLMNIYTTGSWNVETWNTVLDRYIDLKILLFSDNTRDLYAEEHEAFVNCVKYLHESPIAKEWMLIHAKPMKSALPGMLKTWHEYNLRLKGVNS